MLRPYRAIFVSILLVLTLGNLHTLLPSGGEWGIITPGKENMFYEQKTNGQIIL